MTVRLLTAYRYNGISYGVGNLLTADAGTETGLVNAKWADSNLTGGTTYVAPVFDTVDKARGLSFTAEGLGPVGPDGGVVQFAASLGNVVRVALMGDSMTASAGGNATATSVTRLNGVVTVVATGVNLTTGMIVRIYNCLDTSYNNNSAYVTRIDANTITYVSPGADGSTSNLTGLAPMTVQNNSYLNSNSYLFWLNSKTGGAFRMVANGGSNGNTSANMLPRIATDCLAFNPQAVIIMCGYNDFPGSSLTAAQVFANVTAMIAQCVGKLVVVVSAIPWTSGGTTANRQEAAKYNRLIRAYCNSNPRCRFADAAKYLVDFNNATRFSPLAGMLRTDNIHPSPKGAERIAQSILDAIQFDFARPSRLVNNQADTFGFDATNPNILDNAPFTNTGGAVAGGTTGAAAAQYAVTLTNTSTLAACVASCPARADGIGFDQQAVFTAGGVGDVCTFSIGTGNISGRFTAGDRVLILGELSLSGLSGANIRGFSIGLSLPGTSGSPAMVTDAGDNLTTAQIGIDGVYTLVSNEIVIPVGCTGISWSVTFTASAAGTPLTVKLGRCAIEKI